MLLPQLAGSLWHLQGSAYSLRNQIALRELRQRHQPHPVWVDTHKVPGYLQGQSRLARTARPGEGKEPGHGEHALDLDHLPLATYEAGPRGGQVVLAHTGSFFLPREIHRRCHRKAPGGYLVAQPATRCSGLRTKPSGEDIAESFVLGESSLWPA